jgi:hypothetical protein
LCLELVQGNAQKLGLLGEIPQHLTEFLPELQKVGVTHTRDSSVFAPEQAEAFKVIDFAVCDAVDQYYIAKELGE